MASFTLLSEGKLTRSQNDGIEQLIYLKTLQHLVPHCPKDRRVSKLELIQAVIDYIYDLEQVLLSDSKSDLDSYMQI